MPGTWTFLTNHGHVLVAVAADPHARLREIAARVGITERAAQLIVRDLEASGYLSKERVGRRNRYLLHRGVPFRHSAEADRSVDQMLAIFVPERSSGEPAADVGVHTGPATGDDGGHDAGDDGGHDARDDGGHAASDHVSDVRDQRLA
jgi:hypothetical protein